MLIPAPVVLYSFISESHRFYGLWFYGSLKKNEKIQGGERGLLHGRAEVLHAVGESVQLREQALLPDRQEDRVRQLPHPQLQADPDH